MVSHRFIFLGLLIGLGSSCSNDSIQDSTSTTKELNLIIESPVPKSSAENQQRAYNPDNLILDVLIDGARANTERLGNGDYRITAEAANNPFGLSINWSELVDGSTLQLATYQGQINVQQTEQVLIAASDYESRTFDNDKDGDSNLTERLDNTNPFNSNSCSWCRDDVDSHVNLISSGEAPTIDGLYDPIWNESQFKDTTGDAFISILDILESGYNLSDIYENGVSPFQFASMHDGNNLYLMVFGEKSGRQTPVRDSGVFFGDDDAVAVVISDGIASTDGIVEELVFGFSLLDINGNPTSTQSYNDQVDALINAETEGGDSPAIDNLDGIEVATCQCSSDRNIWEIKIPLQPLNLSTGDVFNLQMVAIDDVDGGFSDVIWIWSDLFYGGRVVLSDR